MNSKDLILKVAVQTPLHRTFDYLPLKGVSDYQIGQRVRVPFGRRTIIGVITNIVSHSDFPKEKLKPIEILIDEKPLLSTQHLALFQWASTYYCHPIGDVILSNLPKKLRQGADAILKTVKSSEEIDTVKQHTLTDEQQCAVDVISNTSGFKPFLLAGVTGSGKTEVYLRVIEKVIANKKQALVLVPEIALTPQTVTRFQARINTSVLLLHSGLSDGKRMQAWLEASEGEPCVVIGTRSAVFAPLTNLGVIVVDESHDVSFKQQSRFRYCARDVAVMRAKLANVPIILGTATPALESYYNVKQSKYELLRLTHRPGESNPPKVILHDVRKEKLQSGLSPYLIEKINAHLENSGQVLIYINRRGYAPVLICHHCGWTANCKRCDAKLTAHQNQYQLICHHCGFRKKQPTVCESCQQSKVMLLGLGTEQLEETLNQLFPSKHVLRVDRDNVRTFTAMQKTLEKVHDNSADILVGTQLLVKGHHFENVSLVAAIDVDNALFSADFRAIERLGQSLVQVAGRSGRSKKQGEVIIQTHQPEHPLLQKLFQSDYFAFAAQLLEERKATHLPPYGFWAILRAEAKNQKRLIEFLEKTKKQITQLKQDVSIFGPVFAAMPKKANVYRANLLVQSALRAKLHDTLKHFIELQERNKSSRIVRWVLDIDPVEVG